MNYSSMGLLGLIIQLIIEFDVYKIKDGKEIIPAHREYRRFLIAVLVYYAIDASWGVVYDLRIMPLARLVTMLYFAVVAMSVFLWSRYVIAFLDQERIFRYILAAAGWLFVTAEAIVLILNMFYPLLFYFNDKKEYVPCRARYITLGVQVVLFLITAVYTLWVALHAEKEKKHHYLTISVSGFALTLLIAAQTIFPLLPLYSVGCLLCVCIIHRFVVEGEKDVYRKKLETLLEKEEKQRSELGTAKNLINTDALTGVKSKYAYMQEENRLDELIRIKMPPKFAVALFDVNGLKSINDTLGHEQGDLLIKEACRYICRFFAHSPVFRIGGDEFCVVLTGDDYHRRHAIMEAFNKRMEANQKNGGTVVAAGIEEFDSHRDYRFSDVFDLADQKMYIRKSELKSMGKADSAEPAG